MVRFSQALRWLLACVCTLVALFVTRAAHADLPVIAAGREAEVVALVSPYFGTEKELAAGYKIANIDVQPHAIRIGVDGPGGKRSFVVLEHPSTALPNGERTPSFAVRIEQGSPEANAAHAALLAAIRANDKGTFWPAITFTAPGSRYTHGAPHWVPRLPALMLRDGILVFLGALVFVSAHLRRALRDEPKYLLRALLFLLLVGAVLRLTISREAAMNVWPYERIVPLARLTFEGTLLPAIAKAKHAQVYLTDVIFKTSTVLAIVTPLVFFAHARYVLRDARAALFAAALLVVLPLHIRFSRSDTEFIQSLATSSLTFVVLYTALRDQSRVWRTLCFVLLPIFSVATYFLRPENRFFYAVDIGAILITSGEEAPRRRKILATVEVTAAAAFAFTFHLLAMYRTTMREAIGFETLRNAVGLFFNFRLNTLINPGITPPGLTLLAIYGGVTLYRRGHRGRALFLASWLLGFFVVHSFVTPTRPEMQARYHMHLITPLLLLAASALPAVLEWPRRWLIAGAAYLAASPLLHLPFERDVDFNEMREFAFLREARRSIPDGCTVLEFMPAVDVATPDHIFASRLDRMSIRLENGVPTHAFKVVNTGIVQAPRVGNEPYEGLSAAAADILRAPPPCLMIYEGITCYAQRPEWASHAPVCDEVRNKLPVTPVASLAFGSRLYDEAQAGRIMSRPEGRPIWREVLRDGAPIELRLYRATPSP